MIYLQVPTIVCVTIIIIICSRSYRDFFFPLKDKNFSMSVKNGKARERKAQRFELKELAYKTGMKIRGIWYSLDILSLVWR